MMESKSVYSSTGSWDELDCTADELAKQHIMRLQQALEQSQLQLDKQRQTTVAYENQLRLLDEERHASQVQWRAQQAKLQLSERFTVQPHRPTLLMVELASIFSNAIGSDDLGLIFTCLLKTGDSWVAVTSSSASGAEMVFKSSGLDNFVKYGLLVAGDAGSMGAVADMHTVLPSGVSDFLGSGHLPANSATAHAAGGKLSVVTSAPCEAIFYRIDDGDDCRSVFVISRTQRLQRITGNSNNASGRLSLDELLRLLVSVDQDVEAVGMLQHCLPHLQLILMAAVLNKHTAQTSYTQQLKISMISELQRLFADRLGDSRVIWKAAADGIASKVLDLLQQENDNFQDNDATEHAVSCDFLITSHNQRCELGSNLLMLSADRSVWNIHTSAALQPGMMHDSFENALRVAVSTAMATNKPHVEFCSRIAPGVGKHHLGMAVEHHLFLAVPLESLQVRGVVLVQLSCLRNNNEASYDGMMDSPFSSYLLGIIMGALDADVKQSLVDFLDRTNYRPLSMLTGKDECSEDSVDVSVIQGMVEVLHNQDDGPKEAMVSALRGLLHCDWVTVFVCTSADVNDQLLQIDNDGRTRAVQRRNLPLHCQAVLEEKDDQLIWKDINRSTAMGQQMSLVQCRNAPPFHLKDIIDLLHLDEQVAGRLHLFGDKAHNYCSNQIHRNLGPFLFIFL